MMPAAASPLRGILAVVCFATIVCAQSAWQNLGHEVWHRGSGVSSASSRVFIGYAGWNVTESQSMTWVDALAVATLIESNYTDLYAVGGPETVEYQPPNIDNAALIKDLLNRVSHNLDSIVVAGHSSGSFVAHQLLNFLLGANRTIYDPTGVVQEKITYFDLDGGQSGLDTEIVSSLRRAYFTYAADYATNTMSPNSNSMKLLWDQYAVTLKAGLIAVDSSNSHCNAQAIWCVHVSLINQRPWNPANGDPSTDYVDFDAEHPVTTAYLAQAF